MTYCCREKFFVSISLENYFTSFPSPSKSDFILKSFYARDDGSFTVNSTVNLVES